MNHAELEEALKRWVAMCEHVTTRLIEAEQYYLQNRSPNQLPPEITATMIDTRDAPVPPNDTLAKFENRMAFTAPPLHLEPRLSLRINKKMLAVIPLGIHTDNELFSHPDLVHYHPGYPAFRPYADRASRKR